MGNGGEMQKVTSIVEEAMDFVSALLKEELTDQFKFHKLYTYCRGGRVVRKDGKILQLG